MRNLIVSRLGGDAAATSEHVKRAAEIITSNPERRYVIVSAPGSTSDDLGITDLLYLCYSSFNNNESYDGVLTKISDRFNEIVNGLGIDFDVDSEITSIRKALISGENLDYIGSRGEYIMSKIFAKYLNWNFIDSSEIIFLDHDKKPDKVKTFTTAYSRLKDVERAIIPSFYGSTSEGKIKTFARGDCDTTGALVSCAVNADLFEKWSETAKIRSADPSVIDNPEIIRHITYIEAVELNYIGINLMKDDVALMLNEAKIPMTISSIYGSEDDVMYVSPKLPENISRHSAVCITGYKNFNVINIHKIGMNKNYEFEKKFFEIFDRYNIAARHYITGIHSVSVFLKNPRFDLRRNEIINDIKKAVNPSSITATKGLSLIAIVGDGIAKVEGLLNKIFSALSEAEIELRVVDYGADKLDILLGVSDEDYEKTIKVLYNTIIKKA